MRVSSAPGAVLQRTLSECHGSWLHLVCSCLYMLVFFVRALLLCCFFSKRKVIPSALITFQYIDQSFNLYQPISWSNEIKWMHMVLSCTVRVYHNYHRQLVLWDLPIDSSKVPLHWGHHSIQKHPPKERILQSSWAVMGSRCPSVRIPITLWKRPWDHGAYIVHISDLWHFVAMWCYVLLGPWMEKDSWSQPEHHIEA